MDARSFALAMAQLAVVALVLAAWAVARRARGVALAPTHALTATFGIATVAMLGSLTFSEIYHFTPCRLCWYQRFAMYPLSLLLGVALVRQDLRIRRVVIPVALVGAGISTYHVILQRYPTLESTSCDPTAPCTAIWVEPLGVFTIPTMALAGFVAIVALLAASSDPPAQPEHA